MAPAGMIAVPAPRRQRPPPQRSRRRRGAVDRISSLEPLAETEREYLRIVPGPLHHWKSDIGAHRADRGGDRDAETDRRARRTVVLHRRSRNVDLPQRADLTPKQPTQPELLGERHRRG